MLWVFFANINHNIALSSGCRQVAPEAQNHLQPLPRLRWWLFRLITCTEPRAQIGRFICVGAAERAMHLYSLGPFEFIRVGGLHSPRSTRTPRSALGDNSANPAAARFPPSIKLAEDSRKAGAGETRRRAADELQFICNLDARHNFLSHACREKSAPAEFDIDAHMFHVWRCFEIAPGALTANDTALRFLRKYGALWF